jgi:hypothetical protein
MLLLSFPAYFYDGRATISSKLLTHANNVALVKTALSWKSVLMDEKQRYAVVVVAAAVSA